MQARSKQPLIQADIDAALEAALDQLEHLEAPRAHAETRRLPPPLPVGARRPQPAPVRAWPPPLPKS